MKSLAILILLTILPIAAYAESPLLMKTFYGGYTVIENYRASTCSIYSDKVVVKKSAGRVETTESRPLNITEDITGLISKARQGEVFREAFMIADGVETIYLVPARENTEQLILKFLIFGKVYIENKSSEAKILISFLDEHCFE